MSNIIQFLREETRYILYDKDKGKFLSSSREPFKDVPVERDRITKEDLKFIYGGLFPGIALGIVLGIILSIIF